MYGTRTIVIAMALLPSFALAEMPAEKTTAIAFKDNQGNTSSSEKDEALRLMGNAREGQAEYKAYCEACHLPTGGGNPDGSIPQLAGQHSTVLIKQMADIRSGLRFNPTMYPFVMKLADPQALANVATYIATLCVPPDSGKYQGQDAASQIAAGKQFYEKECIQCHKQNGEGAKEKFHPVPVLAGQHYAYLLRQMIEIRDGKRGNAQPEMVRVIAKYDNPKLVAISAYMATLAMTGWPGMIHNSMCNVSTQEPGHSRFTESKNSRPVTF